MKDLGYSAKDRVSTTPNDTEMKEQLAGKKREHVSSSSNEDCHGQRNRLKPEPNLSKARKAELSENNFYFIF